MKFLYLPCFQHASTPACSCAKKCLSSRIKRRNPDLPHMSQISSAICYGSSGLTRSTKRSRSKKLPECCIYCIYSGGICMESAGKITRNGWPWRPCSFQKQLSWFRNSKAFNEKRSEWIPGKNMDEPWTILTRLSQAQSAHGFGSSQGCLPVCMILIQLDWFILVSYHPDIISAILFQTAKDVEFLCSSMFNHWMHHHLPAYYFQLPWLFQDVSGMVWLGHVGSTAPSQRAKVPNRLVRAK